MALIGASKVDRRSATAWDTANPTLAWGITGVETGSGLRKIGDGTTAWNALAYTVGAIATYDQTPLETDIHVSARHFQVIAGTPVLGGGLLSPCYLMDATGTETIGTNVLIPTGWASVNVDVQSSDAAATGGDVRWSTAVRSEPEGFLLTTAISATVADVTVAATDQDILRTERVLTGATVTGHESAAISLSRIGGATEDTLPNDIQVYGVVISQAS